MSTTSRLVGTACEVAVVALALGVLALGASRPQPVPQVLRPVHLPAPQSPAPSPSGEGPLELRTLVLHPDVEESFPARTCEAQGLPDDENDCDLPPLMT